MLTKTVKAAATTTDQGEFTAIAAAYTVDRMNDRIMPGAFADTIGAWQSSGKNIPLHWDHGGDPADIIGFVDPKQMREAEEGLYVKGKLDLQNSEMARQAWRAMKDNAVGLSFGYLVNDSAEGKDGVMELKALDLFELTITPAPANPDTKLLSLKNANEAPQAAYVQVDVPATSASTISWSGTDSVTQPISIYPDAATQRLHEWMREAKMDAEAALKALQDSTANEDASSEEPPAEVKHEASDSLSKGYEELAFRLETRGITPQPKSPPVEVPDEGPSLDELTRDHDQLMYRLLTGSKEVPS